ncbi:tripartite motif-containing protein 5-like isoform X10 [Pipistrellus kuhlii]|uniref:tripartite motif-containing protein 5-like isoform X10 n=1 Tax=Pipistrellus kuhlii TaxID=59472 RepID=UPI001E272CD7|nr:tripartite motif-containing protein 5-like isoform X10 [Pipistrellus kuhlii]
MGAEISEQEESQFRTGRKEQGTAAMASGVLVNIKEVMTCPICLELLTEPMSLDCGHSFCQACITANNGESVISQGESSCPVCRIRYQPGNLRPSLHLANIVEVLKEVKVSPEEEQKSDLCVHHGEKLLLFCKEDGKIICWLCERSQEHRGHHTFLMEEIAQEYQEKIQRALASLIAKQQKAEKLGAYLEEETTSWKDVNGILKRSETFTLRKLETLSKKQRRVFQVPDLRGMLQVFNELTEVRRYWANMTLDHQRANSNISTNAYKREVRSDFFDCYQKAHYPYKREEDEDNGVLGLPPITSGKHYWEVDVSQTHAWILGVCKKKIYPNRVNFRKQDKNHQPVCSQYQPKNGYWVIGLQNESEYKAFVDSPSSEPSSLPLFLKVPPRRIGVFLDYNTSNISFLNITNHGFLIYKFSSCLFNNEVYPYFNFMNCPGSLKLCSPSS